MTDFSNKSFPAVLVTGKRLIYTVGHGTARHGGDGGVAGGEASSEHAVGMILAGRGARERWPTCEAGRRRRGRAQGAPLRRDGAGASALAYMGLGNEE